MRSIRHLLFLSCWLGFVLEGCMLVGFDEVNRDGGSADAGDATGQAGPEDAMAAGGGSGGGPGVDGGAAGADAAEARDAEAGDAADGMDAAQDADAAAGSDATAQVDTGVVDAQADVKEVAQDATAGVDGSRQDAETPAQDAGVDAAAKDAKADAADSGPDAASDDAGSDECPPLEIWCDGNTYMVCDADGTIAQALNCSNVSSGCHVGECNPDTGCDMVPVTDSRSCGSGASCNLEGVCVGGGPGCTAGASPCEISCDADVNLCALDCNVSAVCGASCGEGSTCNIDCSTTEVGCEVHCAAGSECEIDCRESGNCNAVTCAADAECLLRCPAEADACGIANCEGAEPEPCDGNIWVCHRDCPL